MPESNEDRIREAERFRGRVEAQLEHLGERCDGLHAGLKELRGGVAELEKWRWKVIGIAAGLSIFTPLLVTALRNALVSAK